MAELMTHEGMPAWIAERLPGRGRILPAGWRMIQLGGDGAAYRSSDGLVVILSGESNREDGKRWLHLSLSRKNCIPSFEDVKRVKELFLGDVYAVQVFPPRDRYVNIHPNVLHLFSCADGHPLPEFSGVIGGLRTL